MRFDRIACWLVVPALLFGCEAKNLYVAHHTVVGVNAQLNSEQTAGHLIVGYDRKFGAVVPKSVDIEDQGGGAREAMAALSCSELEVDGIFLHRFVEYLATGEAARIYAKRIGGVDAGAAAGIDHESAEQLAAADKIFDCLDDR